MEFLKRNGVGLAAILCCCVLGVLWAQQNGQLHISRDCGTVPLMSGSCGNGQEKSRYCCRKEVRIKIPFRAVTIFPAPDISLQG